VMLVPCTGPATAPPTFPLPWQAPQLASKVGVAA
jgi:hypothetical protein